MEKEEWRKIEGYDDYFISNLGNIKSLKFGKVKFLKKAISSSGYYFIKLFYNNSFTRRTIHQLVAVAFLDHIPCGHKLVVDHIDFNRLNNNINNLRIVTSRENASRKNIKSSSKYVGVGWHKSNNKWRSKITINGKEKFLGLYDNEIDASIAYQNELKNTLHNVALGGTLTIKKFTND